MALTAVYDAVLSRIRLSMTAAGATAVTALFDRSVDNITYTTVRGGSAATITTTNASVDDYEFPPGVLLTYRVRTYTAASVLVDTFTATITQDLTKVWLKVPAAPFLNTAVTVVDRSEITRRSRTGLFDVVGRTLPVSVGDVASGRAFSLQLLTNTAGEEDDLDYLFASGEIVFLQLPSTVKHFPGGYYTAGDVSREPTLRLSPRRVWSIPLTEVAKPGPAVVGSTYTCASVLADYATVTAMLAANATIAILLDRTASPVDVIVA